MAENDKFIEEIEGSKYACFGSEMPPEELITSLVEGSSIFRCKGTARVKVGNKVVQIPIRSVDLEELTKTLPFKKPTPPTEKAFISPNSKVGKELGLKKGQWVEVIKPEDEDYQNALQEYNSRLGYLIVLKGLDIVLKDRDGNIVWDPDDPSKQDLDRALEVLRGLGMTGWQFEQISNAIRDLTKFEEQELEKNLEEALG
jgi:hypothetical protein